MFNPLSFLRREIDWQIQNRLTASARYRKKTISTERLLAIQAINSQRYRELEERYQIGAWQSLCNGPEYQHNLFILDILDRYQPSYTANHPALDIGSSSWYYLPALYAWQPVPWHGIELDAHRRFVDMTTRRGRAEWMTQHFPSARYHSGSLLKLEQQYGFISWFLPFIIPAPLRHHGLPERFFQPEQLLEKALSLLVDGGGMLIFNQGEKEFEQQQQLLSPYHLTIQKREKIQSPYNPYEESLFLTQLVKKPRP